MNYISHLTGVMENIANDQNLKPTHISLYLALFQFWNLNRFANPISINRGDTMRISKIGSNATYHNCMTQLNEWGYLKYVPSHNPFLGSLVYMYDFGTRCGTTTKTSPKQAPKQVPEQALYPSINNNKQKKQLNNTNIDSVNLSVDTSPKNNLKNNFLPPSFDEVKLFFTEKKKSILDAEKFYNHFESNGWLVGGKSKMKNWHAAARNWIINSNNYEKKSQFKNSAGAGHLHIDQDKDYTIPL
jgi:hypothetical protein